MAVGLNLLRLLEPAVRPAGVPGAAPGAPKTPVLPLEQRSFDALLEEARRLGPEAPQTATDSAAPNGAGCGSSAAAPPSVLGALAQVDRIENPSLRMLVAGRAAAAQDPDRP